MKNIWYIQPAEFAMRGDTVSANYIAVPSKSWRYRNNGYLLDDSGYWQSWMESFSSIQDCDDLLDYLNQNGFPHMAGQQLEIIDESISKLLGAASYFSWIITLLELVKPHKRSDIKQLCKLGTILPVGEGGLCTATLIPKDLKNWNGFQKLAGSNEIDLEFQIRGTKEAFRRGLWEVSIADCRQYVFSAVNLLVEGISPRIQRNFNAEFSPRTPYEAMCLALFAQATGSSVSRICQRLGCTNLVFSSVQQKNGRKPRGDRAYCSGKCRQFVYDDKKRSEKEKNK